MDYEYILTEKSDGVAILTMNRPAQLNAMNRQLTTELHDAVMRMSADETIGCIVITGAGTRAFSAGGDIHEQRENDRKYTQEELETRNANRGRGSYDISACPTPTIGIARLQFLMRMSADEAIGCIVITGAGTRAFSAGGDIH